MVKAKPLPPVEVLREHFSYDPETGIVTRNKRTTNRNRAGDEVGWLNPGDGYLRFELNGKVIKNHRLAWKLMTGIEPPQEIDHINRDKADNRWTNLRKASYAQNQANRTRRKHTHLPGARQTVTGLWYATASGKHLGMASSEQEAHDVYVKWHREQYGEFSVYYAQLSSLDPDAG